MSSISTSLTGTSLLTYLQNMSSRTQAAGTDDADATSTAKVTVSAATKAALVAASKTHQSSAVQASLDKQQTTLAADLRAAMAKAGVQLSGAVSFSLSSAGKLVVNGSDADKAAVSKFLNADTSSPSFATRVGKLAAAADSLSSTVRQSASISQAARYAGNASGVLSLYETLSKQQDTTPATFMLSSTDSSLTYAGVLTSKA